MKNNKQLILKYAESLYDAKVIRAHVSGKSNSYNLIFETEKSKMPFILRVSEYSDTKKKHTDIELNWMNYLAVKLNNIVKPVKSVNNNLYEIINADDKSYILCLFEKANGKHLDCNNPMEFNTTLFYNLGALMGHMHKLTVDYKENSLIIPEFMSYCAGNYPTLPKSKDCFGKVHNDVQINNLFVDDNAHISLFDFDDWAFSWYAEDIALHFFYIIMFTDIFKNSEKYIIDFSENYLMTYFKGYTQAYNINKYCMSEFNSFLKHHMIGTYSYLHDFYNNKSPRLRRQCKENPDLNPQVKSMQIEEKVESSVEHIE